MKILVVLTGGTIGSRKEGNLIDVSEASSFQIIDKYYKHYDYDIDFDVISPISILSENLTPDHWITLCKAITSKFSDGYDGIIVTHGSDTLAYTSAFLGLVLAGISIPITITASNYELNDSRSVGLSNFASCVDFIRLRIAPGIFTLFGDGNNCQIYLSTRIRSADSYLDQFSSFGPVCLGSIQKGIFTYNNHPANPSLVQLQSLAANGINLKLIDSISSGLFSNTVLVVSPYPGLDYSNIDIADHTRAVLHYLYHSATACISNDNHSIRMLADKCRGNDIEIYASSFKSITSEMYVTASQILDYGFIPLMNISPECAYVKLLIAYNQSIVEPQVLMNQNIFFESIV